jgi:hypothetical protein
MIAKLVPVILSLAFGIAAGAKIVGNCGLMNSSRCGGGPLCAICAAGGALENQCSVGMNSAAISAAQNTAAVHHASRGNFVGKRFDRLTECADCSASNTAARANGSSIDRAYSAVLNFSFNPSVSSILIAAVSAAGLRIKP